MGRILRNKIWHYRKRVPRRFRSLDPRAEVLISLHTDSASVADAKIPVVEAQLFAYWEALERGEESDALASYDAARMMASARGYRYRSAGDLAAGPLSDIVQRVDRLRREFRRPEDAPRDVLAADLGGVPVPQLRLSGLFDIFEGLSRDALDGKSADQTRRWRNPRLRAIANMRASVGDKVLVDIGPQDALDFRDWWLDKIEREGLSRESANKDISYLSAMMRTVSDFKRLGMDPPFTRIKLRGGSAKRRPAFDMQWICTTLIDPAPLAGLNAEARDILLAMVNTGARPSEITGLLTHHICVEANIPHIKIRAEGKTLKTPHSERDIPLVGISLEAMRRNKDGFPRYCNRDKWSDVVNKFLRENDLLPGDGYTAYSLRHAFEDRLLAQDVPDRLAADLMGHSTKRPKYGDGSAMEQKLAALLKISV